MRRTISYSRVPEIQCLGRNRYFNTAGADIYVTPDGTVCVEPRTGKNISSGACRVVFPVEDVPMFVATLWEVYRTGRWGAVNAADFGAPLNSPSPGRLARIVAKWRGAPVGV